MAHPPKSQSTLSETGIPLQTSVACSLPIHSPTNKPCCCGFLIPIIQPATVNREFEDRSSQLAPSWFYFFLCMTFKNMIHIWPICCIPCSFILSFFFSPLWNIFYILHLRLLAAAVIQSDLKPVGREECITLLKGVLTGHVCDDECIQTEKINRNL